MTEPRDDMKKPCEVCGHRTTLRCVFCYRALCAPHAAWNRDTETHASGELACPRPNAPDENTTWPPRPVAPRSWSLPPEPPAGTRLRGIVTVLRDGADHPCEYQRDTVFPDLWVEVGASHRRFTWGELLTREGPLTEVVDSDG